MMTHLKPKSLAFYGIAIGLVLLLFNRVTAYGNANLRAPAQIDGRYLLKAQNLPPCLRSNSPVLTIEQSGTYVAGFLTTRQKNLADNAEEKPSLTGRLSQNGDLTLMGVVHNVTCSAQNQIKITGTITQNRLNGQLQVIGANTERVQFTAQRQAPAKPDKEAH